MEAKIPISKSKVGRLRPFKEGRVIFDGFCGF